MIEKPISVGNRIEPNRHDWILSKLQELPAGTKLLDAGAGQQAYRDPSEAFGLIYTAQDFAAYDGVGDGSALQTGSWNYGALDITSDISDIPRSDGSFDAVLCTSVLEHTPDQFAATREFARLLRPGGRLILSVPTHCFTHFAPYYFFSGFSKYFWQRVLPDLGFAIDEQKFNGSLFEHMAMLVRQLPAHAPRYSGVIPDVEEEAALATILKFLQRAEDKDNGSNEFCSADLLIVARRL